MPESPQNLEQMLDQIAGLAGDQQRIYMRQVVESVGSRSFGPLLLVIGVTLFSPLSGIPGMAVFAGLFVMLIALQMLIGRKNFWLPAFILNRSVPQQKLLKAIDWVKPGARRIDRLIKPRLSFMMHPSSSYLLAGLCVTVAAGLPFLELVPFSSCGRFYRCCGQSAGVQAALRHSVTASSSPLPSRCNWLHSPGRAMESRRTLKLESG